MALNEDIAARLIRDLHRDFPNIPQDALIGFVGTLSMESKGFNDLHEDAGPGVGYSQWTGARKTAFQKFVRDHGLSADSYEANYGYLKYELEGNGNFDRGIVRKLENASSVQQAVDITTNTFLIPGVKNMPARYNAANEVVDFVNSTPAVYAQIAQAPVPRDRIDRSTASQAIDQNFGPTSVDGTDSTAVPAYAPVPTTTTRDMQTADTGIVPNTFDAVQGVYEGIRPPGNAYRNDPVDPLLRMKVMTAAYYTDPTVQIRVTSGGQMPMDEALALGAKPHQEGNYTVYRLPETNEAVRINSSQNHDDGGAVDFYLTRNGQRIDYNDEPALYDKMLMNLSAQGVDRQGLDPRRHSTDSFVIHAGGEGKPMIWDYPGGHEVTDKNKSYYQAYQQGRDMRASGDVPQLAPTPAERPADRMPQIDTGIRVASNDDTGFDLWRSNGATSTPVVQPANTSVAEPPMQGPMPDGSTADTFVPTSTITAAPAGIDLDFSALQDTFATGGIQAPAIVPAVDVPMSDQPSHGETFTAPYEPPAPTSVLQPAVTTPAPANPAMSPTVTIAPIPADPPTRTQDAPASEQAPAQNTDEGDGSWLGWLTPAVRVGQEVVTQGADAATDFVTEAAQQLPLRDKLRIGAQMLGARLQAGLGDFQIGNLSDEARAEPIRYSEDRRRLPQGTVFGHNSDFEKSLNSIGTSGILGNIDDSNRRTYNRETKKWEPIT